MNASKLRSLFIRALSLKDVSLSLFFFFLSDSKRVESPASVFIFRTAQNFYFSFLVEKKRKKFKKKVMIFFPFRAVSLLINKMNALREAFIKESKEKVAKCLKHVYSVIKILK